MKKPIKGNVKSETCVGIQFGKGYSSMQIETRLTEDKSRHLQRRPRIRMKGLWYLGRFTSSKKPV